MKTAQYWIEKLDLQKHPEGGWFKEVYKADETIKKEHLHDRYSGDRHHSTSIYFLITNEGFSALHRVKSDETWHFYTGSPLAIHMIDESGNYKTKILGEHEFQFTVPKHVWFGATVNDEETYSLVGCTVAPGFHFDDFELGDRKNLQSKYPGLKDIIDKLTRL